MLFKPKKLVLTKRQQAVIDHFGQWMKTQAERDSYFNEVEAMLREMPGASDMKVAAIAIKAASHRR
jgi:hypothetical protein